MEVQLFGGDSVTPNASPRLCMVDGNQLCALGNAAQIVLFYKCLVTIARPKQRLDILSLTDSVNA
jgi:hypothetical protein